jgi:putative spermidine/putrescine transport system permease protein
MAMQTKKKSSLLMYKLSRWCLLLPVLFLMLGIFVYSLVYFFNYSLYGYEQGSIIYERSFGNYLKFITSSYYLTVLWNTVKLSGLCTIITFFISYPLAYTISRSKTAFGKQALTMIVFIPLIISVVVRSYGWYLMLSTKGFMNWLLQSLNIVQGPLDMMYNQWTIVVGMVHVFLPFMVFPILTSLTNIDPALKEAASDLGANRFWRFVKITFPLTLTGVLGGVQIVFTLGVSSYVIPQLLGGGKVLVLSRMIYNDTLGMNWPMASTAGVIMLLIAFMVTIVFNKAEGMVKRN